MRDTARTVNPAFSCALVRIADCYRLSSHKLVKSSLTSTSASSALSDLTSPSSPRVAATAFSRCSPALSPRRLAPSLAAASLPLPRCLSFRCARFPAARVSPLPIRHRRRLAAPAGATACRRRRLLLLLSPLPTAFAAAYSFRRCLPFSPLPATFAKNFFFHTGFFGPDP